MDSVSLAAPLAGIDRRSASAGIGRGGRTSAMNTATFGERFASSPAWRWTREPFVHFLAIGLALLVLYYAVSPARPEAPDQRIELTADDLRQIDLAWLAKWQRHPTQMEMQALVEARVREEVLYREALALGLGQDDTIVKRRLAQKLEFLSEDVSAIRDPTPRELEAWYGRNVALFAAPSRITFQHLYFSPDVRGARAPEDARSTLTLLTERTVASDGDATLGDRFFDRDYYPERTPDQVAALFGTAFSQAVFRQPVGGWHGPVESGLGWHLVRVDAVTAGSVPRFADADREQVRSAWIDEQRDASRQRAFEAMRAKYEVVMPGAGAP
jgi:peptidyl-prolyl cis-trans isomerase C